MGVKVEDYKIFEEMQKAIEAMGEQWREEAEKAEPKQTFAGIQSAMQSRRLFMANERKQLNDNISNLSSTWSAEVIERNRKALNKEFDQLVKIVDESVRNDIKTLVSAKKQAIADMLVTPPTTNQLNLLKALEMRSGDVDSLELTSIMPSLFGNYQSMRILKNIGVQSGNTISFPVQLDCKTMFDNLTHVEDYLMQMCNNISTAKKDLPIESSAFYCMNPGEKESHYDPIFNGYVELLDTVPQLNTIKVDKTGLSGSESAVIKHLFKDVENLNPTDSAEDVKILKHTQKVMKEHPDTIEILKLSDYGKYVAEVEAANNSESE